LVNAELFPEISLGDAVTDSPEGADAEVTP